MQSFWNKILRLFWKPDNMLSLQQVFDLGVKGVRSQDYKRSVSEHGTCRYSHSDGVKHCAIGWVFVHIGIDDTFIAEYEGVPVDQLDWFKQFVNFTNVNCLWEFQLIHDSIRDFDDKKERKSYFEQKSLEFALEHNLVYTAP